MRPRNCAGRAATSEYFRGVGMSGALAGIKIPRAPAQIPAKIASRALQGVLHRGCKRKLVTQHHGAAPGLMVMLTPSSVGGGAGEGADATFAQLQTHNVTTARNPHAAKSFTKKCFALFCGKGRMHTGNAGRGPEKIAEFVVCRDAWRATS
jgi:hypothetical protein